MNDMLFSERLYKDVLSNRKKMTDLEYITSKPNCICIKRDGDKFNLSYLFFQLLPNFYHCPGIEFAVTEKSFATGGSFCGFHELDFGEECHGITAILTTLIKVVVVQAWLVREQCRQHTLDGEWTMHRRYIVVAALEWC